MQLLRDEFGQRLVQSQQHGSRVAGGPLRADAILFPHAIQEGLRGEP
jgi:hypothetical protein